MKLPLLNNGCLLWLDRATSMRLRVASACALLVLGPVSVAHSQSTLPAKVYDILVNRCTDCHGEVSPEKGLNVLNYEYLVQHTTSSERRYVIPNDTGNSFLFERIAVKKDMPPDNPLDAEEIAVIKSWMEDGARSFVDARIEKRPYLNRLYEYRAVASDLRTFEPDDRQFIRYYSLVHLHNNPNIAAPDLRKFQAALSKLANSLSWKRSIRIPEPVDDPQRTLLRFDLRDFGWDEKFIWDKILSYYPYGLAFDRSENRELRLLADEVYKSTNTEVPIIRADWFIATASHPPLYHDVLDLPKTDVELEQKLKVDIQRDFANNKLRRAGFTQSKVSVNNRLVDRHEALFGAYWKSYDFKSSTDRANLLQFPLGPVFSSYREFEAEAFEHDGGEIIFNLPNGLQGYMIVDATGARIDEAPVEVVRDTNAPAENVAVINGLSCIVCHKEGMRTFEDVIRSSHGVARGAAKLKIERLYRPPSDINRLVNNDMRLFARALGEATGQFLQVGRDREKAITDFDEPVGAIVKQYSQDLSFDEVFAELSCVSETEKEDERKVALTELFKTNDFKKLHMGVFSAGARLKRELWEDLTPYSAFQLVSEKLDLGRPVRFSKF